MTTRRKVLVLAVTLGLAGAWFAVKPQDVPFVLRADVEVAVHLEVVVDALAEPVHATHAGDGSGRLFIVERAGVVRVLDEKGELLPTPLLDISAEVASTLSLIHI